MNAFYKMYCRTFQAVLKQLIKLMPWRKPELLRFDNGAAGLAGFIKGKGLNSVLVVTDGNLMKLGLCAPMLEALEKEGVKAAVYDKVVANPTIDNVEEALKLYNESGAQGIIAFGGGSPMDCAKGVGARVARPNKPIPKMKGILKVGKKMPPFFAIPTTSGTGSETTLAAVITDTTDPNHHLKYAIQDFPLIPHYAVLDYRTTTGLPAHITATTGMDALVHAVESYLALGTNPLTQDLALASIRKIAPNLAACVREPDNAAARAAQSYGSLTAGMAFAMSGTAGVHAMAYPLGGEFHVPHGEANTAMLRWVMEYNLDGCPEKFVPIAEAMGINTAGMSAERAASAALDAMIELGEECGVKTRLRDFGIPREAAAHMAKAAMKETRLISNNPRKLTEEAVKEIYERAW